MKITYEIAKALENKDLCRRAGPFWLEVMYFLTRPTGCAHRQRYAAITAREYLTALSMIKYPKRARSAESWHRVIARCIAIKGGYVLADPGCERIGTKNNIGRINRPFFYAVTRSFHASEYWMFPSQYFQVIRS